MHELLHLVYVYKLLVAVTPPTPSHVVCLSRIYSLENKYHFFEHVRTCVLLVQWQVLYLLLV